MSWNFETSRLDIIMIVSLWILTSRQHCLNPNPADSSLFEILSKASVRLANRGTGFSSFDIDPIAQNYPVSAPGHLIYYLSEYIIHPILKRNSDAYFQALFGCIAWIIWRIMYVTEWRTFSVLRRGLCWVYSQLRKKHQNNARVSAETVRRESTSLFYFLHDIRNP